MLLLSPADYFQNQSFQKIRSGIHQCQTAWMQIRPGNLSGLIRVQTINEGYQQTTGHHLQGESISLHAQLSSVDRDLKFGLSIILHPYFGYDSSECHVLARMWGCAGSSEAWLHSRKSATIRE